MGSGEPQQAMTSERLAAIREHDTAHVINVGQTMSQQFSTWMRLAQEASADRHELLAEVERQRELLDTLARQSRFEHEQREAREAALLAFVERVAATPGRLGCRGGCRINERWNDVHPERWGQHSPDCPVEQARALLASVDEQGEA